MMFLTEIKCVASDNQIHVFTGPIITAKTEQEAQEQAFKMNSELKVTGEYVDSIDVIDDGMGIFKL